MAERTRQSERDERTDPANEESPSVDLVRHLAAFLKAGFVYPSTHERVVRTADDVLASRAAAARVADEAWISIRFTATTTVEVGRENHEIAAPLVQWARQQFVRGRQAGVRFGPDLDRDELLAYADSLRGLASAKGAEFDDAWMQLHPNVRPIPLVYAGRHEEDPDVPAGTVEIVNPFPAGSSRARLFDDLVHAGDLALKIREVRREAERLALEGAHLQNIDLLAEVITHLSTDVLHDAAHARQVVLDILDATSTELMRGLEDQADDDGEAGLSGLLRQVASKFFDFEAPEREDEDDESLPQGRPEDESVDDDFASLLDEIAELPQMHSSRVRLLTDRRALDGELLGVYLHTFTAPHDPTDERRAARRDILAERIVATLDRPGVAALPILQPYIAEALASSRSEPMWGIVDLLRAHGRGHLLRETGHLTADVAAFAFPDFFALFVDSIDVETTVGLAALRDTVQRVGRARIAEHADALCAQGGEETLLLPERASKLLRTAGHEVLPLAALFAERGGAALRTEVVRFLRKFDLPSVESLALRAVHPPSGLPPGYVHDLCHAALRSDEVDRERLRDYSSFLLRKFIEDATAPEMLDLRLQAILQLRLTPSAETIRLLEKLKGSLTGALLGDGSRKQVRQVAAKTLKEILG